MIECSGAVKNKQEACLLLHEIHKYTHKSLYDHDSDLPDLDLNHGGGLKLLVTGCPASDVPRFWAGINLEKYKVEDYVFACAPPSESEFNSIEPISETEYARNNLKLMSTLIESVRCGFLSFMLTLWHQSLF